MVSGLSIFFMFFSFLISSFLPVILMIYLKTKYKTSLKGYFIGIVAFFLATQILELPIHYYFLSINETTSALLNNPIIYMVYGGLMAGVFEETARLLCFKYILKKEREVDDGIAYGLGHGGIEAMIIIGISYLNNIVFAQMINDGSYNSLYDVADAPIEFLDSLYVQMTEGSSMIWAIGGLERILTIIIHIGLTLLVLKAIKESKLCYYVYAVLLHALVNFPAALSQRGAISNIFIIELWLLVIAIGFGIYIFKQLKKYNQINISNTTVKKEKRNKFI